MAVLYNVVIRIYIAAVSKKIALIDLRILYNKLYLSMRVYSDICVQKRTHYSTPDKSCLVISDRARAKG